LATFRRRFRNQRERKKTASGILMLVLVVIGAVIGGWAGGAAGFLLSWLVVLLIDNRPGVANVASESTNGRKSPSPGFRRKPAVA